MIQTILSRFNLDSLQKRFASALVLATGSLAVVYIGGYPFIGFLFILGGIIAYEWFQLSEKLYRRALFLFAGLIYLSIAFFSLYVIRETYGLVLAFLFMLLIWSSDSGAYFSGKIVGGPKMLQIISPNKTWAGLIASIIFPAFISVIYITILNQFFNEDILNYFFAIILGACIGMIGQLGDLVISAVKRAANVKDTGSIIPGHGGFLDRMDSMILAAPVYLALIKHLL